MKEELLNILMDLHKTNTWDLALDLIKWLENITEVKESYYKSILWFMKRLKKISKDEKQVRNLEIAIAKWESVKEQEKQERQSESKNIEKILEQLYI